MPEHFADEPHHVVQLRDGQVVCERIYWDQASVLVQIGLLDPSRLPVVGAETARKVLDPSLPSNELIQREGGGREYDTAGVPQ